MPGFDFSLIKRPLFQVSGTYFGQLISLQVAPAYPIVQPEKKGAGFNPASLSGVRAGFFGDQSA
jgi:hypothetical protein